MQTVFNAISRSLRGYMLGHAFTLMEPWVAEFPERGFSDRLRSLRQNYQYTMDYYMAGEDDPHRGEVLDALVREGFILLDEVYAAKRLKEQTDYETRQILAAEAGGITPVVQSDNDLQGPPQVFHYFWFSKQIMEWELDLLDQYILNPQMEEEAMLGISGLTLNILRTFSEPNILALMKACSAPRPDYIQERAWVSLLLVLFHYDYRLRFFPAITNALQELLDTEEGRVYACTALNCVVRTLGVPWATEAYQHIQEQMLRFVSDKMPLWQEKKGSNPVITAEDIDELGEEARDEFRSMIEDRHDEIRRLQEDYLDTNYGLFRSMYGTPFFSEPFKWWLPFDTDYLSGQEAQDAVRFMNQLPMDDICESDKFAFVASILGTGIRPADSGEQGMAFAPNENGRLLCNNYTQQAYRFFTLNPWGIPNVFEDVLNVADSNLLRSLCPSAHDKLIIAEQLLRCHAFSCAAQLYEQVADTVRTADTYRHMGWAYQKDGNDEKAIAAYQKAFGLERDEWTARQMLVCQFRMQKYEDALLTCTILLRFQAENPLYLYKNGKCLEHLELYAEALTEYYHALLLQPDNTKVMRSIAWCAFLCSKNDEAEKYYLQLMDSGRAQLIDHLNYGHLLFVTGKRMDAFVHYQQALRMSSSLKHFLTIFRPDRKYLLEMGIPTRDIYLMEDQIITSARH